MPQNVHTCWSGAGRQLVASQLHHTPSRAFRQGHTLLLSKAWGTAATDALRLAACCLMNHCWIFNGTLERLYTREECRTRPAGQVEQQPAWHSSWHLQLQRKVREARGGDGHKCRTTPRGAGLAAALRARVGPPLRQGDGRAALALDNLG